MKRVIVWIGVGLWLLAVGESRAVNFLERELEFGGKGAGEGGFSDQIVLGFDAQGNILVSDAKNRLVQKLDPNGRFLWQYPAAGAESSVLMQPGDIAADPAGNVYVADTTITPVPRNEDETPLYLYTPCVHKFSPSGEFLTTIPIDSLEALPSAPATPVRELITPEGTYALGIQPSGYDRAVQIALDPQGNLFVLDAERPGRQRILKYSPEGERLAVFGRYGSGDGAFDTPEDFTVAPNGHVYIADTGNHRIVEFDNDGAFVRAFASQGYGKNELTKPSFIVATREGELWVSDETKAVRRQLGPLGPIALGAGAAPQWSVVGDEGLRILPRGSALDPLSETEALALRLYRLEELFLLDEEEEEQEALTDEALKQAFRIRNTLYHKTIHRIARFDTEGNYRGEISYRVDQLDERRHDLRFLAADPLGHVYLLDASELTVLKHRVVGFTLRPSEVDAISSSRFSSQTNNYLEDYEDIDQLPDIDSEETLTRAHSRAIFNWDLTRNWSAYLEEAYVFSGRDGDQEYPDRVENSLGFEDRNWDNLLTGGIRWILNPNPYRFRQFSLYATRQDGSSRLDSDALFPELNRQRSRQEGDSAITTFGLDWDILRNANLRLEYQDFNPSDTNRNYIREFYDLQGNLYQIIRSQNRSKTFVGELNIKF